MLSLHQISLSRGQKVLLNEADLTIYERQKLGLIGQNGCGKSTLFALILGDLIADAGDYHKSPHLRISHLAQEVPDSQASALDYVLAGDEAYRSLILRLAEAERQGQHEEILSIHLALEQMAGYSKPAEAASILSGLGFDSLQQKNAVNSFSGGWRMRLNLARCLMKPADLLLLDEPTNHLDMEAIAWLEKWLKATPASVLVISHDRDFLDAVVTHIVHLEHHQLHLYTGHYSFFEKARAQKLLLQQAAYEKQQNKIKHMMSFVERFGAKATKARQAQSRLKAIERMEIISAAQLDSPFSFSFKTPGRVSSPLISLKALDMGYYADKPILKQVNFLLNPGDRIALLGPNGQGKSTFIKTLTGEIQALKGEIDYAAHLQIGYYAQHQLETLNPLLSPIETILSLDNRVREQEVRDFLGGFAFHGDMAAMPITHFSGGEKARLALAKLVWQQPNVLLLDEPTNHLDLDMRAALELALQTFEGALILISHDRHLLRATVDEYYLVFDKGLRIFEGELDDYYAFLTKLDDQNKAVTSPSVQKDYRERKSLQNRLKKLEEQEQKQTQKLASLNEAFADMSLYEAGQQARLSQLTVEKEQCLKLLQATEEEWLSIFEQLSEFDAAS